MKKILVVALLLCCRPAAAEVKVSADHFVPAIKKLAPTWVKSLTAKGERTWYRGDDLKTIGMPVGGICAGQVYLTGDGRLAYWAVFNRHHNTGYGRTNYDPGRAVASPIEQGFAVCVTAGGKSVVRALNRAGFPGVRFCGEYPIGIVEYKADGLPVAVGLEAFSPFIPLNADDSALPATVMRFTVTNTSSGPVEVTLAGWLENAVCFHSRAGLSGVAVNSIARSDGVTTLVSAAEAVRPPEEKTTPVVFEDFEGKDYGKWTVEGKAFGKGPAHGTLTRQQPVSGFLGKALVNTYLGGDDKLQGKLISPEFTIERKYIRFLVGGGPEKGKTCMNLIVGGKIVRTATGRQKELLLAHNWKVDDLIGKKAHLEIVDAASGPWGHINIDQIEFADRPKRVFTGPIDQLPDYGSMALAAVGPGGKVLTSAALPEGDLPAKLFDGAALASAGPARRPFGQKLRGAVGRTVSLAAGAKRTLTFIVAWCFPNRPKNGNYYANRYPTARAVAEYVGKNIDRLGADTRLWHDTYYDSTLPHWLLDRLGSTVSTLATNTCHWWANGRFWAWEGVGCCHGTCGHVWNYAHAPARLFPRLERSVREMQDFNPKAGFIADSGAIRFRGEGWGIWAGDSQGGYVLKAYREHQCSKDQAFLKKNWPSIRKAVQFLIQQDGNADGLIEGKQHNTYDIDFYGPNAMIGSLYLAALRAGEEMASELGDDAFAARCRKIFESGRDLSVQKLFNGEYFIQIVDLKKHPKHQYGPGCLSDQLFGQGWAHQVGLGYVYPKPAVLKTLASIWKYNWAPDVGPQNKAHKPERWFARPGEAGLFTCTWPRSKYLDGGVRYKNEVWTGIEYQVAGNMAWDGMVTEALAICRAVHDRYHPARHNPFNEVECGDHYARGMASWGVLLGLAGFELHGPKGHMALAPRISPDNFKAVFTAPEGWGSISQTRKGNTQTNRIEVKWGRLVGRSLAFEVPKGVQVSESTATLEGQDLEGETDQKGTRVTLVAPKDVIVRKGEAIVVQMSW